MEGVVSFSLDQFIEPCTATTLALGLPVVSDGSLKRDPGHFLPIEVLSICSNSKLGTKICPFTATFSTLFLDTLVRC